MVLSGVYCLLFGLVIVSVLCGFAVFRKTEIAKGKAQMFFAYSMTFEGLCIHIGKLKPFTTTFKSGLGI